MSLSTPMTLAVGTALWAQTAAELLCMENTNNTKFSFVCAISSLFWQHPGVPWGAKEGGLGN